VLRHRLVGDEHELLDDPVRDVSLERNDGLDHALVVENDFRLLQVEVDGTAAVPPLVEDIEQLAHLAEERYEIRVLGAHAGILLSENRVDVRVRHPGVAVDDAVVQLVAHDLAAAVDLHEAGLHEAVDVRIQAAESSRQLRRKHVDGALRKVHRRRTFVSFLIEGAALGHVVRDVGDVDAEPVVPIRQSVQGDRVVEVARVLAVDRDGHQIPEIGPAADIPLAHFPAQALRLRNRLLAVLVGNPVLADDDLGVDARLFDVAEHLRDAAERPAGRRRPARDVDDHHVAGRRLFRFP
jgi:hypothetical protein